ncbi:nitrogen fixation negative regulator NifL [Thiosocius teredinicola]|uniref:nitrogen fixation negative regulator NifL n=1 Tax=Thiosocius teredinicola TaxID=1973002 RepID=UPI002FE438DE
MSKRSPEKPVELVPRTLGAFLDGNPNDTPAEIVEAFNRFCAGGDNPLSPHLFFQLVELAPIALSIADDKANILYANRRFEQLTGYKREDVIGQNESILSNKATPREVYQDLWTTVTGGDTWTGKLVNRTNEGKAYLAELTISPGRDNKGNITHYLGMHRDITQVYELQCQVANQKGLFETILDTAPVVVALLDVNHKVILDNQEYKKLLGDLRGTEPAQILMQAVAEQGGREIPEPGMKGSDFRNQEVRLEFASSGSRWFVCSATWLADIDQSASSYFKTSKPQSVCLFVASETTRQRREHERARMEHLRASLSEQQRIRGMREALAAATYQIQQPLNLINAATAMLGRQGDGAENLLQALRQIGDSAQQAYETLRNALPQEDEEPQQLLNLNEVAQEVLQMVTDRLLKNGIVVTWRPSVVLSAVNGRAKQVRGLLMNIVDNAIIALSESSQSHRELTIGTSEANGVLVVTIEDNGPGVPSDERMAVFNPLHCGWTNKVGHAGMGLAVAQEIAIQHGGGVVIDDTETQGCRVRIEFPVAK